MAKLALRVNGGNREIEYRADRVKAALARS
jgi:hypothetical protein